MPALSHCRSNELGLYLTAKKISIVNKWGVPRIVFLRNIITAYVVSHNEEINALVLDRCLVAIKTLMSAEIPTRTLFFPGRVTPCTRGVD